VFGLKDLKVDKAEIKRRVYGDSEASGVRGISMCIATQPKPRIIAESSIGLHPSSRAVRTDR